MPTHPEYVNANGTPIDLTVKVWTRPNLREGVHEMRLYMGKAFLDNIFDKKIVDQNVTKVWAYYPETWCNIPELQSLVEWIPKFYPNVTKIDIETHSVYIIQTVRSSQIGIYDKHSDFPQEPHDHMRHLAPAPEALKGLHVCSPDGTAAIQVNISAERDYKDNKAKAEIRAALAEADKKIAEFKGNTKEELDAEYAKLKADLERDYEETTGKKWSTPKSTTKTTKRIRST